MSKFVRIFTFVALIGVMLIGTVGSAFASSHDNDCKKGETYNSHTHKCEQDKPRCDYGENSDHKCNPKPPVVVVKTPPPQKPYMRCSTRFYPGGRVTAGYMKFYLKHCNWVELGPKNRPGENARPWFNK